MTYPPLQHLSRLRRDLDEAEPGDGRDRGDRRAEQLPARVLFADHDSAPPGDTERHRQAPLPAAGMPPEYSISD